MKIEIYIENNELDQTTANLFHESIICYKTGAYKASFIFSYVALLNETKTRVLKCGFLPDGLNKGEWDNMKEKLLNDDEWGSHMFTNLIGGRNIFDIKEQSKEQIKVFRTYRNACAHGKKEEIDDSTVNVLWNFIISHLNKFQINGSFNYLINKITDYLDFTKTPVDEPFDMIKREVISIVNQNNFDNFFCKLINIDSKIKQEPVLQSRIVNILIDLYSDDDLGGLIRGKLEQEDNKMILMNILRNSKSSPCARSLSQPALRSCWLSIDDLEAYAHFVCLILEEDMLSKTEYDDLINNIMENVSNDNLNIENPVTKKMLDLLKGMNIIDKIVEMVKESNFDMCNRNSGLFIHYLEDLVVVTDDKILISKLYDYSQSSSYEGHPNELVKATKQEIRRRPEIGVAISDNYAGLS